MNHEKKIQDDTVEEITEYEIIVDEYGSVQKKDRKNLILLLILFLVFGLPAAGSVIGAGFSVLTGIISLIVGIFGGLIGLVFSVGAAAVALVGSGVALIISGCFSMTVPATGVMMIGAGFFLLSASVLAFVLTGWGCGTVIPGFVRFCVDAVKKCSWAVRKVIRRIGGKESGKDEGR